MRRLLAIVAGLAALAAGGLLAAGKAVAARRVMPEEAPGAGAPGQQRERPEEKRRWVRLARHFGLFVGVLAVGGFLVAASGIVPIKASSGHWAVTRWLLSFGSHRSVATHTLGLEAPPLDSLRSPALVLKGAAHYDFGCRPCHGSPGLPHPRIAQAMTPHPPYLPPVIAEWEPDELFYIVKHGIKFTGMPAWPTQERDDEVWAMVAFLLALPDLDAEAYRRLAQGEAEARSAGAPMAAMTGTAAPEAVAESCARCHGADGLGRGAGAFPKLAGQRPSYLYAALLAYARGERHSGVMQPVAAGLSDDEMQALARYYGGLDAPAPLPLPPTLAPSAERGAVIARRGIPSERVPACAGCHGPSDHPRNPFYPDLAGQYAEYLVLQLQLFAHEHRGGSPYARLMHPTAHRLTPEQRRDVARYYEALGSP